MNAQQYSLFQSNTERAAAEYGHLIGQPAEWTRVFSVFVDGKRPTFRDDPRRVSGVVVQVSGGADFVEYSPRLIVYDGDLEWWLPPETVSVAALPTELRA